MMDSEILLVFIDGLKPESVEESMPFLNSLILRRIKSEMPSYSNTCHASMYTGVFPNKHLHLFMWKYHPQTSVFGILKRFKVERFPHNIYTKYLCYKLSLLLGKRIPFHTFGFHSFVEMHFSDWYKFDLEVVKFWGVPQPTIGGYPTFFKILRDNGVPYDIVGMNWRVHESSKTIKKYKPRDIKPLTFFFVGDVDALSGDYGQSSPVTRERLREIDGILEEKYEMFRKKLGDFYFIVFSDHGHKEVENYVDIYSIFKSHGKNLHDYIYFLDSVHARFWFRSDRERREVETILSEMQDVGSILTEEEARRYNANVPDNRFGDLIFYLYPPHIFNIYPLKSIHGYPPSFSEMDGVLISNKKLCQGSYVKLEDIAPSVLQALDLNIPKYMDGKPIW